MRVKDFPKAIGAGSLGTRKRPRVHCACKRRGSGHCPVARKTNAHETGCAHASIRKRSIGERSQRKASGNSLRGRLLVLQSARSASPQNFSAGARQPRTAEHPFHGPAPADDGSARAPGQHARSGLLRQIQIAIRNADPYPETVSLELILINSSLPGKPSQSLGSAMVKSKRPGSSMTTPPTSETLNFAIPRNRAIRRFDEVMVVFRLDAFRADAGPKIAIDHLVLVPRGL